MRRGSDSANSTRFPGSLEPIAEQIGLIKGIQAVRPKQKRYTHTPQTKVLEFLVAILGGLRQLQETSLAAHPAEAWEQPAWADYTGISRTLSALSWGEAYALVQVVEQVS